MSSVVTFWYDVYSKTTHLDEVTIGIKKDYTPHYLYLLLYVCFNCIQHRNKLTKTMKTRKTKVIHIRVSEEEKKLLELKARRTRKTLSAYILSKTINK
jgi:hypothetical protein